MKEEAINTIVLELVRLTGVALTPPIDAVELAAFEPEEQVKLKYMINFQFLIMRVLSC